MKKLLVALFLCSSILCQAKDFYYEGMSFQYKHKVDKVRLYPHSISENGIDWIYLSMIKEPTKIVFAGFAPQTLQNEVLKSSSPVIISRVKNSKKTPEQFLESFIEKTMEESFNLPKKQQIKSVSDIYDGMVGDMTCKFVDVEKPKGARVRQYCFKKNNDLFVITISWTDVKKLKKLEGIIEELQVINTFDFVPE